MGLEAAIFSSKLNRSAYYDKTPEDVGGSSDLFRRSEVCILVAELAVGSGA